jgi:23S rRNA (adenine2503-C2)-methyltransferase
MGDDEIDIISEHGNDELAKVYVGAPNGDKEQKVEFVESLQPPHTREEKWVLIVSSLYGCPVGCLMCDAGGDFKGKVSKDDILKQIDFLVTNRYPDRKLPQKKFKIQFARMGEPALNPAVLDVLEELPKMYDAPGLLPSISTVAPMNSGEFFTRLKKIKDEHYPNGQFQLQFSLHSTDETKRDELIPVSKWSMEEIASFGKEWMEPGDRKVTLNFAFAEGYPLDPEKVRSIFDPENFLIKLTPVNPTHRAEENRLITAIDPEDPDSANEVVNALEEQGFEVILSIGEVEENQIGSNCGMYLTK